MNPVIPVASIPSPTWSGFHLGPLTIHAYALCILLGIVVSLWLTSRRWRAMGEDPERIWDIVLWAIPFGLVGARMYHVFVTAPGDYFGPGRDPMDAFKIWEGGIGIMGAVTLGGLGAWIACRRMGLSLAKFADAAAPGIIIAQGIGRWGNWFNQELFGKPTTLPWGLEIDPMSHNFPVQYPPGTLFHPTFLYESVWDILGGLLLLWLGRKFLVKRGQVFWTYVMYYGIGRFLIELFLRIDESDHFLGLRIHVWTSGTLVVLALVMLAVVSRRRAHADEVASADSEELASSAARD